MRTYGHLSESGRAAVGNLIRLLEKGYTGDVNLKCSQGGVRNMYVGQDWAGKKLKDINEMTHSTFTTEVLE